MTKSLHSILKKANIEIPEGLINHSVRNIVCDSREVKEGDLFIGLPGEKVDGGAFWQQAISSGAVAAVIGANASKIAIVNSFDPVVIVDKIEKIVGKIASIFWDFPSSKMFLIGVTGTNGKTTTSYLIEHLLQYYGIPSALFGTLSNRWPGYSEEALHTTSFPDKLQSNLALAVAAGAKIGAMEVSSHALAQRRVEGCNFSCAIFTNLTQDHLDYHNSMEDYFAAKSLLFSPELLNNNSSFGIVNIDDYWGRKLANRMGDKCWRSSLSSNNFNSLDIELKLKVIEKDSKGTKGIIKTPFGEGTFTSPLLGSFNLMNILQAVGALLKQGLPLNDLLAAIKYFPGVPGRMEKILPMNLSEKDQLPLVIVDYAHTPDGLEKALISLKEIVLGDIICVFGCGGNRDRGKRSEMGAIASKYSDKVILTSDNPRLESPEQIFSDVLLGIDLEKSFSLEPDRSLAINMAISQANVDDLVLIAGKGHESYQILGNKKIYFNDKEEALRTLERRK